MGQSTRRGRAQEVTDSPETRRLRALLSSVRDIVLVRDRGGVLTYCSPSVFAALGYEPAELVGTLERDLVHESDLEARDCLTSVRLPGCAPAPPFELRFRDRSGEWHWFEAIESNRLDDPDVQGIVTTARDVTSHRAENAELRERSLRDPLTGDPEPGRPPRAARDGDGALHPIARHRRRALLRSRRLQARQRRLRP